MKKILSLFLSVLIVLSCIAVPTFATKKGNLTEKQYDFLFAMGSAIEKSYEAIPDGPIQRGVAARRFCYFGKLEYSKATFYEALFYDLSTDHYYYPYIKGCYDAGAMIGYPDGTFRPDDSISTMEAAKVFLYIIGYGRYMEIAGIDSAIKQTKLLDGISEVSENMNYVDFYRMMYNAYHAPACVYKGFSNDGGIDCSISDDYLGLEYIDKIKYSSGVVDGIIATSLEWPDDTMTENMISIDGTRYAFDGDAEEYLGYHVDFYYKTGLNNKTDGNKVVYVRKSERNKVLVLDHKILDSYRDHQYKYVVGNKYKTVEITKDTDIIYNGVACPTLSEEEMIPQYGTVTLVDNDKTPGYDVAIIENFEFFLIDTVDSKKFVVTDQNENVKALDMEKADVINIIWDGEEFPIERLLRGNFLKVKRTKPDCGYYVCNIEVFKDAKNNVEIKKATEDLLFESTFEHPIWNNLDADSKDLLKAGKVVTLHMYEGTVVRVSAEEGDSSRMGYLMNAVADGVINKEVSFRIMETSTSATTYNAAKKVKLDGTTVSEPDTVLNYLAGTACISRMYSVDAPYAQPIRFRTNNEGLIIAIDTMYMGESEDEETGLSLAYPMEGDTEAIEKGCTYRGIGSGIVYCSSTHIATFTEKPIKVPLEGEMRLDDKNYVSTLRSDDEYQMEIFNLDTPINKTKYAVVYTKTSNGSDIVYTNDHTPAIISGMNKTLTQDGEIEYTIDTYHKKTTKTFKYDETAYAKIEALQKCDVGDVVQIHEDKFGMIDGMKMVFDISEFIPREQRIYTWGAGGAAIPVSSGYKALYTTVVVKDATHIRTTLSHPDDDEGYDSNYQADTFAPNPATIYKYSYNRGEPSVTEGAVSDIVSYEQSKDGFTPVIIIYNHNSGAMNNMYIITRD